MTTDERFARHMPLFGAEGQKRLQEARIAVVGVGGLGTHVVQQLALLGIGYMLLVDSEELAESNRNRYVGARHDDPIPGSPKVDIGKRLVHAIDPTIDVKTVQDSLVSEEAFAAMKDVDCVFGCLDREGARLVLNEFCASYGKRYLDLASDVVPGTPPTYGGRISITWGAPGCIVCFDQLDLEEASEDLEGPIGEERRKAIYGVNAAALNRTGPSVVSINGVVASLAVTEFMVGTTGIRQPRGLLTYRGNVSKVTTPAVDANLPRSDCYYCESLRRRGIQADVERYIREGVGKYLR